MQQFVIRQNIERFRELLVIVTDEADRQALHRLLKAERAKLEALNRTGPLVVAPGQTTT